MKKDVVKKILAGTVSIVMGLSCFGCSYVMDDDTFEEIFGTEQTMPPREASDSMTDLAGLKLNVDRSTGALSIERPVKDEIRSMGEDDKWTIFVYLCGTDLESDTYAGGMATNDLYEMLGSSVNDDVRFVIEAGGTRYWQNDYCSPSYNTRLLISDGSISVLDKVQRRNMGDAATLADFLNWGIEEYPSEHMGVILWDHGGGSVNGICFDELSGSDSLTLREMDAALLSAYQNMTCKFDFIGFDACIMGTIETANILATYADYMYASEESEPGYGWDYKAIGKFLANDPDSDGLELGKVVCDSFLDGCLKTEGGDIATLSVTDLSKVDKFLEDYNLFSKSLYEATEDAEVMAEIARGVSKADTFGANNRIEGYTNMMDLGGLISSCGDISGAREVFNELLNDLVVYNVTGDLHRNAAGLATYYPIAIQGSSELAIFSTICVSPYYLSFVDRQGKGNVNSSNSSYDYADDLLQILELWGFGTSESYTVDSSTGYYEYEQEESSYWDYGDDVSVTGESPLITFQDKPQVNEDGNYWFSLDENGWNNTSDVYAVVFEEFEDDILELGETYDVICDWENNYFADMFDGYWMSLPDGQNLATYLVELDEDHILYTSPILLNGRETYLRIRQDADWSITVEGAWDGIDNTGASARNIIEIGKGDVITPLYYGEEDIYRGDEYKVSGQFEIEYCPLEDAVYYYAFDIEDAYGDYLLTDFVAFEIDGEEIFFLED